MGWLLAGLLLATSLAFAGETVGTPPTGFDRTSLAAELARPLAEVRQQGPEALRTHVSRLADLYAGLDLAQGISPEERRNLSDRILARVAQVGLLVREGGASDTKIRHGAARVTSLATLGGATGFLGDNSFLVIGLLGGLIIAYALGSLAGYRRGASQASYYGTGDPRLSFVTRSQEGKRTAQYPTRITLEKIREALASGKTVLLQLGYEIAPKHRREFLRLMREMHRVLNEVDGNVHSVWEDPRHPNRFYEIVACDRPEALDNLTRDRSELAGLDSEIEACWLPGGPVVRRAWWGVLPNRGSDAARLFASASAGRPEEDRVS